MTDTHPTRVRVDLADRAYDIVIGRNVLGSAGDAIRQAVSPSRVFVVTDDGVAPHHLGQLTASLTAAGVPSAEPLILPAGEATKSWTFLSQSVEHLLEQGVDRQSAVIALGGGVIGDLAGFVAASTLRGLDYVQIPTSLLAQVDSSVGGKTGINTAQGKNLVGAFHQPRLVLIDLAALDTLPERELRAGYAEIMKYGLINRPEFFDWLDANIAEFLDGDESVRLHAIAESCRAKAEIVCRDEREAGDRALLNLGHTFAHALEGVARYDGRLIHGEAVAMGCCLAFRLSERLGLCEPGDTARVEAHVRAAGLPATIAETGIAAGSEQLWTYMGRDKKVRDGRISFVLAERIGRAFVSKGVEKGEVLAVLEASGAKRETPEPANS